jgi:hypothetical protein
MKRSKTPSFSSKGNYSITSYLKQMNQYERGLEFNDSEDYVGRALET